MVCLNFKVKCAYCKKIIYERAPSEADKKLVVFCSEECLFNYKHDKYWKKKVKQ